MKNIVAFSGGKDSTAMLLRMIELKIKIDEIVFADTEFEFPELYEYIEKIEKHIGRKITKLKHDTMKFGEYKKEQSKIMDRLAEKGIKVETPIYKEGWTDDSDVTKFEQWFYGMIARGDNVARQRGFPLRLFPCWWTRESKVNPLKNIQDSGDKIYIGIAYDEQGRMSKVDKNNEYPLVQWEWTEQDCITYLNKKNLFNPLYVNFDRLGCWHCPKQGIKSLYVLWKNYPKLWKILIWWDDENYRVTGMRIKEEPIEDIGQAFKEGKKPKKLPKYDCWNGCESVKRAFKDKQYGLGMFIDKGPGEELRCE